MSNKTIHIVSLDVPFPPDYGGMIDVFYRIKALHSLGFSIILHSFSYGRGKPKQLDAYCKEVHYYARKKRIFDFFSKRPFIVQTRISIKLLNRLLEDNHPVLLEGLHCCWYLEHPELQKRLTIVRTHNIEHEYYEGLMKSAAGLKRIFFSTEAKKLKQYEQVLSQATYVLSIKQGDKDHFKNRNKNTLLLPASLPEMGNCKAEELKKYCLFHGNLSVSENDLSAKWLLENVIPKIGNIPFIIAGKNPSESLKKQAERAGVQLVENPPEEEMNRLVSEARVHVLPSTQDTGLKLKLLSVLQTAGSVIVNPNMVKGNDLGKYCIVAGSADEFVTAIQLESAKPVNMEQQSKRIKEFLKQADTRKAVSRVFTEIGLM